MTLVNEDHDSPGDHNECDDPDYHDDYDDCDKDEDEDEDDDEDDDESL